MSYEPMVKYSGGSVLKHLADNRIMRIARIEDSNFEIEELCDEYYGVIINAEQLRKLGQELVDMANEEAAEDDSKGEFIDYNFPIDRDSLEKA